jgi:hypothetical protein
LCTVLFQYRACWYYVVYSFIKFLVSLHLLSLSVLSIFVA